MSFLLFRQFESMYSFGYDCEWNFGLAYNLLPECLFRIWNNGGMPFTGFSVLSIILSAACIYCLNRSLSIPAWQTSGDAGGEIHNVVIDE